MKPVAVAVAICGSTAFALTDTSASSLTIAQLAIVGATLGAATATDLAEHRIPNRLVLPAALACAALSVAVGINSSALIGLGMVLVILILALIAPKTYGMGDVKLMLVIALGLNRSAPSALILGLFLAAFGGVLVRAFQGRQRRFVPLAPFLALGSLLALI